MANNTTLSAYLELLFRTLCPTLIFVLNLHSLTQPSSQWHLLSSAILQAVHQQSSLSPPKLVIFNGNDSYKLRMIFSDPHTSSALATTNSSRCLFLYLTTDDYDDYLHHHFGVAAHLHLALESLVNRHLVLLPNSMWNSVNRDLVNENIPRGLVVVYEHHNSELTVVSLCQGLSCTALPSAAADLVPQHRSPDIRQNPPCKLNYYTHVSLLLLTILESVWNRCFRTFGNRRGLSVCGAPERVESSVEQCICRMVTLEVQIAIDHKHIEPDDATARGVSWGRQSYVLTVPNWWHWRTSRSATRMVDAIWAISVSLVAFLLLLGLRLLQVQGNQSGTLVLEMWSRLLVVAVPDAGLSGGAGIALATSGLGMWNAVWLTGALFDLRFGAAEWRPVFQTMDDVRVYGVGMSYNSPDSNFAQILDRWLHIEGLEGNRRQHGDSPNYKVHEIVVHAEDEVEQYVRWHARHAVNGSRVYRVLFDTKMVFGVEARITPKYFRGQLLRVSRLISETGLEEHQFAMQHFARQRRAKVRQEESAAEDQSGQSESADTDLLIFVFLLYIGFVSVASMICCGCEFLRYRITVQMRE